MKKQLIFLTTLFLIGCGINTSKSGSGNESNNVSSGNYCIEVKTLAPVINAVVSDENNQTAVYDSNKSKYCFSKSIKYPIKVKMVSNTFIDVDYDGKKTANDIKPKIYNLESYYPYVDLITTIHARAVDKNLSETNTTLSINTIKNNYEKILNDKYDINLNSPSLKEKILNFVAYDYNLSNSLDFSSDLFDMYNDLVIFFENQLNKPNISDKVKYYSFFHSLELLDKKLIERVDTIHRPQITYLHIANVPVVDKNNSSFIPGPYNVISNDIKIDNYNNEIYVASGIDGVTKLDNSLNVIANLKVNNTFSNSYNLNILSINDKKYLFTADGGEGLSLFDITHGSFIYKNKIFWKYYDQFADKNVSISIDDTKGMKQTDEIISVKSYVSPFQNKAWLAFGTRNKGLYLVDFKKIFSNIESNITYPIIIYNPNDDQNNTLLVPGDGGTVYSEAFSNDGNNLYATKSNTIERYDLSSLLVSSTPVATYNIKANNAYNLKMITNNGTDELFVSTDKGVEVYDILNNNDLMFRSEYDTAGAMRGYLPKMSFISEKNILLLTDGYQGLKAIKYDESYNPQLCGVGYFYPYSDSTKLAKVTSVATYKNINDGNYYVIVGIDGFGIAKFKLNNLLFKHCE